MKDLESKIKWVSITDEMTPLRKVHLDEDPMTPKDLTVIQKECLRLTGHNILNENTMSLIAYCTPLWEYANLQMIYSFSFIYRDKQYWTVFEKGIWTDPEPIPAPLF